MEGRNVILVEDILDTGRTLCYLKNMLLAQTPATLKIAAFLDKPERRLCDIQADYVGFSIPNRFVVATAWILPNVTEIFQTFALWQQILPPMCGSSRVVLHLKVVDRKTEL